MGWAPAGRRARTLLRVDPGSSTLVSCLRGHALTCRPKAEQTTQLWTIATLVPATRKAQAVARAKRTTEGV